MSSKEDDRVIERAVVVALEGVGRDTSTAIAALRRRGRTNRHLIWSVMALSVVTALTLAAVVVLGVRADQNTKEIGRVQHRTSDQVLCPLYAAFKRAEKLPPPNSYTPAQKAERLKSFKVVDQGYVELGCGG